MKGFLYFSAFNNIAETLRMDAACGRLSFGNAGACAGSLGKASMEARATPELFMLAARQYLATAGAACCTVECHDPAYTDWTPGFSTKRDGDFLYVTAAPQEQRLQPGMRVVAVGKNTVPFLLKDTGADVFWGRGTDHEDWDLVLRMYDDVDVFPGDGHVQRLDLRQYPVQKAAPVYSVSRADEDALVVRVDSMADAAAVEKVADELASALSEAAGGGHAIGRLVLDLRQCWGEADPASWLALLPYLVDGRVAASDVMGGRTLWTIYSKNNAQRLVETVRRADRGDALSPAAAAIVEQIEAKAAEVLAAKRTTLDQKERRLLSEVEEAEPSPFSDADMVSVAPHAPASVAILVDCGTGAGAERLAQAVAGMEKVRLAGRASSGCADYANYLTIGYDEVLARFTYPISRTDANRSGAGLARGGLPLDVHVPWTPAECHEDVTLREALAALGR